MPNVGLVIKQEIVRIARRELRAGVESLRKAAREQRSQIAELSRQITVLQRTVKKLSRGTPGTSGAAPAAEAGGRGPRLRFSAKGFAAKRQKLGISAAAMAKLLDVSSLSVYKWESGKAHPRTTQIEKIAEIRKLGKREVMQRLQVLDAVDA